MPLLSVVLPVYRVQAYLRECLDSILEQAFTDVEVIAVDDCSPDHSGAILDEYASRDERVKVVHLDHNVGLGEARNAGMKHVTGEFVWFIDSDDWIAPGALAAVADRLIAADPDVLMVDYAKVWWNNNSRRSKFSSLVRSENLPRVFTLAEHPNMIRVFHVAWNKIYRRRFLLDNEITYPTGLYEDVPVGYPVLILADRMAVLDRVCIYYRQRRRGAITSTPGRRHFEVFGQYDLLFQHLDKIGERAEPFRALVFGRMLYQCLLVLENRERVAKGDRREFFGALTDAYRRHLPRGGYQPPGGTEGRRQRVAASGSYALWRILWFALTLAGAGRSWAGRAQRTVRLRSRLRMLYYRFQVRRPIDPQLAVFSAYWGKGYECNPRAVYEKMGELAPGVRGVWEVKPGAEGTMPPGVATVTMGTLEHYRTMARAKYLVTNVNFGGWVIKRRDAVHLSTNHGTPVKAMGVDQLKFPAGIQGMNMNWLLKRCDRWTYSVSPNAYTTEVWERAYPCDYETLETGYPRNDRLATATPADVQAARERLGLQPGQVAVAYLPTYRDYEFGSDALLNVERFIDRMPAETVLLVRVHHFDRSHVSGTHPRVIDLGGYPSVEDIYLAADALITDYSSVMFDYAVLDRPLAIYAADWKKYKANRGAYLDVFTEGPGVAARTESELVDLFVSGEVFGETAAATRKVFRDRFCYLDDGHAAERVVRRVFLNEPARALTDAGAVPPVHTEQLQELRSVIDDSQPVDPSAAEDETDIAEEPSAVVGR
ncbi:bifunctional glycosyltransferase family 2 protein/CDP-glycerol:glycerophosphate glycerophosphotransferase [Actinoplanes sp. Pm04-4]|uniref:Bifunctional glycosyltransferase family 2 protein/CDP-glycerol:glycerophosphate glycerophosphotransferase n=1 Tax=Paractinoplanes pyxinae TaxID=2997416 RepID=A0ABT4ASQ1_9ACTN|nr:bifunctional glycosyltransferase family 2 protein/CDP-glycerol:glycerophosphate glycerophosphotransferase [Actinoplanes pyxinae]MCY1137270.1 bifunctional glycosyltransferase family 2 protein/CDP-glycerol:glycerophosphate glycerophosphotransferase [Actinoplanes pyxinae]